MGLKERIRSLFGDPALVFAVLSMSLLGVAMIYSAGQLDVPDRGLTGLWRAQLTWLGISLVALFVVMRVPVRWLEWLAAPGYFLMVIVLIATLAIGTGQGTAAGTKSWLRIGPMMVQPAQFANVATVLMLGRVMGAWRERPESLLKLWKPIAIVAVPMLLVLAQPDLGTAMVFGGVLLATLYWAGTPAALLFLLISPMVALFLAFAGWIFSVYMIVLIAFVYFYRMELWESVAVVGANLAAGTIAVPLWNSLEQYQKNRLLVFLDPTIDPRGSGYHVIQSRVAIGSGGIFGKGFTEGSQKRLAFLPEQHTDFIYAVIGEELGFIGGAAVILAFGFILWRLARLAERLTDPFSGIVVIGIMGAWFTHVLVNIGMTLGVMPITGIPLPFLSYGGSFLLATYLALGISQRVAVEQGRYCVSWCKKPKQKLRAEDRRDLPSDVFDKCPSCGAIVYRARMEQNLFVCPECGHHQRMTAEGYLRALFDDEDYEEYFLELRSADPLGFVDLKPYPQRLEAAERRHGPGDAVRTATGTMEGIPVALAVMDFEFIGGSMGSVVGEKITRLGRLALERGIPLIILSAAGGARMMEGILSLMQMAKPSVMLAQLHEAGVPFISILTNPTT